MFAGRTVHGLSARKNCTGSSRAMSTKRLIFLAGKKSAADSFLSVKLSHLLPAVYVTPPN
jgi:hypothetical protein